MTVLATTSDEATLAPPVKETVTTARPRNGPGLVNMVAILWLTLLVAAAVFADLLPLADPADTRAGIPLSVPTSTNWLGTDKLGRDLLSRVIYGSRVSIIVGVGAVLLSSVVGTTLGLVAGVYRGRVDRVIMLTIDILLAFPALLLAVAIVAFTDQRGVPNVVLAIAIIYLGATVRIVRGVTLSIVGKEFVTAARMIGARTPRIVTREVLPNVLPTILSLTSVAIAGAIVAEGGLAYLNLSVAPPTPTWGGMMASGLGAVDQSLYPAMVPAIAMFLTVLSLTLLGDHLQTTNARGNVR
jgi:peptide/nickel transport system permease protein